MRTARKRATALIALAALAFVPVSAAIAEPATDGFWYFDVLKIQAAHDAGFTGKGVTIAVIDGRLNPDVPTLQGADVRPQPTNCFETNGDPIPATSTDTSAVHGTNIVSYLVGSGAGYGGQPGVKGIAPDATVLFYSMGRPGDNGFECNGLNDSEPLPMARAIFGAIDAGADIISISFIGEPYTPTQLAVAEAVNKGIPIIAGVPNQMGEIGWPSEGNGVIGVQGVDRDFAVSGDVTAQQNFATDVVAPGTQVVWQGDDTTFETLRYANGTSIATPMVAGMLGLVAQKYPNATGNQLIQSLVHNTGGSDGVLGFDAEGYYGFGAASVTNMLAVDPAQYPDENLLITDSGELLAPTREQIENPVPRESIEGLNWAGDDPVWDPEPVPAPDLGAFLPMIIGAALVGLVIFIGVTILIIVLVGRRGRSTPAA